MVKVIGVDFSGGDEKREVNTWITEGWSEHGNLTIECCRPTTRAELENVLIDKDLPDNTVVAMDFPFSVPQDFAAYWKPAADEMPYLWCAAAKIEKYQDFKRKYADNYMDMKAEGKKHPLRIGDLYSSKPLSCLNTLILPMTFHGMQMLHRLWKSDRDFRVPPLDESDRNGTVLLEVMPGAALEAFRLPSERYKNITKNISKLEIDKNREKILHGLGSKSKVKLTNLSRFSGTYLSHHDGLDSLVAAVVAAQWVDKRRFHCPSCNPTIITPIDKKRANRASKDALDLPQVQAARLEGWIYLPMPPKAGP